MNYTPQTVWIGVPPPYTEPVNIEGEQNKAVADFIIACGPVTARHTAERLGLTAKIVSAVLQQLVKSGVLFSGLRGTGDSSRRITFYSGKEMFGLRKHGEIPGLIVEHIRRHSPLTAMQVATELNVRLDTVRKTLLILTRQGAVKCEFVPLARGNGKNFYSGVQ